MMFDLLQKHALEFYATTDEWMGFDETDTTTLKVINSLVELGFLKKWNNEEIHMARITELGLNKYENEKLVEGFGIDMKHYTELRTKWIEKYGDDKGFDLAMTNKILSGTGL